MVQWLPCNWPESTYFRPAAMLWKSAKAQFAKRPGEWGASLLPRAREVGMMVHAGSILELMRLAGLGYRIRP
jgi:hypothetical protein